MKLLFDQNISFRVVRELTEYFPEAKQVRELNLENTTDRQIWEYAKQNGYTIITFDSDFLNSGHGENTYVKYALFLQ